MSFPDYVLKNHARYPNGVIIPPDSSCYSNLAAYGVHGAVSGIVAPTPVSLVPIIFNKLGNGHAMPKQPKHQPREWNSSTYHTLNQTCPKSEFNQMFSDRRTH